MFIFVHFCQYCIVEVWELQTKLKCLNSKSTSWLVQCHSVPEGDVAKSQNVYQCDENVIICKVDAYF